MEPPINADELRLDEITRKIIGCAYTVANTLGCGFLEKVYENALVYELKQSKLRVEQQKSIPVHYQGTIVGVTWPAFWLKNASWLKSRA